MNSFANQGSESSDNTSHGDITPIEAYGPDNLDVVKLQQARDELARLVLRRQFRGYTADPPEGPLRERHQIEGDE